VREADNLPTFCAVVMKSRNLNFLEPIGSVQACNGTALTLSGGRVKTERDGTRAETRFRRRGCQFSRVLTFLECGSGENDCSNTGWTVPSQTEDCLATHSIRLFPLHFSSRASPCATRFRFHSTQGRSWLRHCATSQNVPAWTWSFQ